MWIFQLHCITARIIHSGASVCFRAKSLLNMLHRVKNSWKKLKSRWAISRLESSSRFNWKVIWKLVLSISHDTFSYFVSLQISVISLPQAWVWRKVHKFAYFSVLFVEMLFWTRFMDNATRSKAWEHNKTLNYCSCFCHINYLGGFQSN